MNDYAFHQCRFFLEQKISETPENIELIKAYVPLIEEKTKFDIAYFFQTAEVQKNWNNNQVECNRIWQNGQTEIAKKQIETGQANRF